MILITAVRRLHQILIKHKFVLFLIHVLNKNVMHHMIYRNMKGALMMSLRLLNLGEQSQVMPIYFCLLIKNNKRKAAPKN